MNITVWKPKALLFLLCFLLTPVAGFPQETVSQNESAPTERNLWADIGYATLGVTASNVALSFFNRLADFPFAHTTFETIWENTINPDWFWENGDRFLVNQFGHAYQGSTYFTSARVNGFNFYQSILFVNLGAFMWEIALEPKSAINDVITTRVSGPALGEMLNRLYLELDSSPFAGSKIGGFILSPINSYNKLFNRPARQSGGGNIFDLSVRSGIEKSFAFLPGYENEEETWNNPGGYIDINVIYGDPFIQQSNKPYDHFELYAGFSTNIASYQAVIISDGYL